MNDAQIHMQAAAEFMVRAITRMDEAQACVIAQGLKDLDAGALSLARTNAEQSVMWAERAVKS